MIKNTVILLSTIMFLISCGEKTDSRKENRMYLARIDSALNNKEEYHRILEAKLVSLKQKAMQAQNIEARYFYNKLIYEHYSSFICDSAFHYIDKNYMLAMQHHKTDWMVESYIVKSKVYSAIGLLDEAAELLQKVDNMPMSREIKLEYYMQQLHYWSQRSIYHRTPRSEEVHAYGDSIMALETSTTSPYYLWARFWYEKKDNQKEEVRRLIMDKVNIMDKEDIWYAPLCFAAGILADALEKNDDALKYYAQGLCVDISHVNRNLPTLPIVASIACNLGELIYANRFMKAYLAMQNDYPDRVRSVFMPQPITHIYDTTISQLENNANKNRHFMGGLIAMIVILLLFLFSIYILFKKQVKLRRKLWESNQKQEANLKRLTSYQNKLQAAHNSLSENSKLLKTVNENLLEANYLKEEYIGNLFAICSDYLGKMNDLKKSISRKLKARQYEDLLKMATGDSQMETEIRELNKHFDTMFLSIFSDFVEEFNTLLKPEERIAVRTGEKLNTNLRIYALVRLGINNSVKIAKILGVSSQTVYNARMKMRSRATESNEDFVQRVRKLGGQKTSTEPTTETF